MSESMIPIGYWRKHQDEHSDLPWPEEGRLSPEAKKLVADYLQSGREHAAWMGQSKCRICGCYNGSTCRTDGEFVYPEGYAHYILDHNIMPDIRLLSKVLANNLEACYRISCVLTKHQEACHHLAEAKVKWQEVPPPLQ